MSQVLILIAEDEARLAAFIEKGLRKSGFDVLVATDGEEAIGVLNQTRVDLMLLDIGLPVKDGWTVLRETRSQHARISIIIVTALSDERDRQRALQQGANDYLTKPFRFSDLLAKINLHLQNLGQA
ncbi:MAG: response regulator [Synechococcales bacterium]|nr:response regulator [Synechococcales bacterium]